MLYEVRPFGALPQKVPKNDGEIKSVLLLHGALRHLYSHNNPISSFSNMSQIRISWTNFKHLPSNHVWVWWWIRGGYRIFRIFSHNWISMKLFFYVLYFTCFFISSHLLVCLMITQTWKRQSFFFLLLNDLIVFFKPVDFSHFYVLHTTTTTSQLLIIKINIFYRFIFLLKRSCDLYYRDRDR